MKTRKFILFLCILQIQAVIVAQNNWYVKATGTSSENSGVNWESAISLNDALARSSEGDSIHIAAGTYIPQILLTNGRVEREKCFEIKNNIALIGGYPADASGHVQSEPTMHHTILSGQLNSELNAYHVLVITAAPKRDKFVKLSGLIIRDGIADNTRRTTIDNIVYQQGVGGGLITERGNVDISDCVFTNNKAFDGAGCWIQNATLNVRNSKIIGNSTSRGKAGGIYLNRVSFNMEQVIVSDNFAETDGGGIYLVGSNGYVNQGLIVGNTVNNSAGGVLAAASSTVYLHNVTIGHNEAKTNGGILLENTFMSMANSTIAENTAFESGGAGGISDNSRIEATSSTITRNSAHNSAGGFIMGGNGVLNCYNSILSGNGVEIEVVTGTISTSKFYQSIFDTQYYNVNGKPDSQISFDADIMLDSLRDNGGFTPTCKILHPKTNPVNTEGLTLSEMTLLASRYGLPGFVFLKDQRGKDRLTSNIAIGAYQDSVFTRPIHPDFWHFIIYGQSLAEGYQSYPSITSEPVPNNYMIGSNVCINNGNRNFNQIAPLFSSPTPDDVERNFTRSWTDASKCENSVVGAANHIQNKLTQPISILATSCATGGKTIEELSKHSQRSPYYYHRDFIKSISSAASFIKRNNYNIECPAIFWMQGEQNYSRNQPGLITLNGSTTDKSEYKNLMLTLKNDMQSDIMSLYGQQEKPLFITYQVGGKYIKGFEQNIAMAQLEASNQEADIICAGPVYLMTDRDAGHLDPNGYRWFGEMLAKVFYKTYIEKETFTPLQPSKITKENNHTLRIDYLVPCKPLVLDTLLVAFEKDFGFAIKNDGSLVNINSVTLHENGESVLISCFDELNGDIEIAYAGEDVLGHGNLRDSDPYQSIYTYIDLDGKDENGEYIFEHDANNTSLHPRYEPRDENGVIYGKPYPLFNFSTHFYYMLPAGATELIPPSLLDNTDIPAVKENSSAVKLIHHDYCQIQISGDWRHAHFYDVSGKLCQETTNNTGIINTGSLVTGIYIIQVFENNNIYNLKYLRL